jgi:hypothetical protein
VSYPAEAIYEEVAYLAFHCGWSRGDILDLEHAERLRYVRLVGRMDAGRGG